VDEWCTSNDHLYSAVDVKGKPGMETTREETRRLHRAWEPGYSVPHVSVRRDVVAGDRIWTRPEPALKAWWLARCERIVTRLSFSY